MSDLGLPLPALLEYGSHAVGQELLPWVHATDCDTEYGPIRLAAREGQAGGGESSGEYPCMSPVSATPITLYHRGGSD